VILRNEPTNHVCLQHVDSRSAGGIARPPRPKPSHSLNLPGPTVWVTQSAPRRRLSTKQVFRNLLSNVGLLECEVSTPSRLDAGYTVESAMAVSQNQARRGEILNA